MNFFNNIDWIIFIGYFILILGIGVWTSRHKKTSEGYFLAGRNMGWIAIGASLFASNISSEHLIGLAGAGASSGFAVGHFELWASIILIILAWIFVPFYLSSGVFTMPEFIQKRFDTRSRSYLTTVSIIGYIITKISVTLYAGGIVLQSVLGWDIVFSAIVLVVVTGVYTILGGLLAVIYTELVQAVILIGGAIVLTILGLSEIGGIGGFIDKVDPDFLNIWKSIDHPDFPWTGVLFGAPILGIWYWCTDQFIVQRVLSARNIPIAQRGALFAAFLKILPLFILVLPGAIAYTLDTSVDGDTAYTWLVTNLLPSGLRGIVIASLIAALMSSLASVFNSASTLITFDFYKKRYPDATDKTLVRVGYVATIILVTLGILWVPFISYISSSIYIYLQSVQAYISPPIAMVFLLGIFMPKMSPNASISALLTGLILGLLRLIMELFSIGVNSALIGWYVNMNFLHFAIFLFVISGVIAVLISIVDKYTPSQDIKKLTWKGAIQMRRQVRQEKGYALNIFLTLLIIVIVGIIWYVLS